jgi:pilus assembly protein CpaE
MEETMFKTDSLSYHETSQRLERLHRLLRPKRTLVDLPVLQDPWRELVLSVQNDLSQGTQQEQPVPDQDPARATTTLTVAETVERLRVELLEDPKAELDAGFSEEPREDVFSIREELAAAALLHLSLPRSPSPDVREGEEPTPCRVAAIAASRGGAGKSTLCALAATTLAAAGLRVAVIDADFQFGDLHYLLGGQPELPLTKYDFSLNLKRFRTCEIAAGSISLFTNTEGPEWAEQNLNALGDIVAAARERCDICLINTGAYWNDIQAQAAQLCDQLLLCMDQRATSIRTTKELLGLCAKLQIPRAKVFLVLNKAAKDAPISTLDASMALEGVEVAAVGYGGSLVDELMGLGRPLDVLKEVPPLQESINELCDLLLPHRNFAQTSVRGRRPRTSFMSNLPFLRMRKPCRF